MWETIEEIRHHAQVGPSLHVDRHASGYGHRSLGDGHYPKADLRKSQPRSRLQPRLIDLLIASLKSTTRCEG
jgi:hypothetical protein